MLEPIYDQDPNQYIKSLSQIKKDIIKMIPRQKGIAKQIIEAQVEKQLSKNFLKYKKNTLIQARIQLTREKQKQIELAKKQSLREYIQTKLQDTYNRRERKNQALIQKKIQSRIKRQQQIFKNKQQIRKLKIAKSLDLIQKVQKKSLVNHDLPIKLKLIQQKSKFDKRQSRVKTQQQEDDYRTQRLTRRTNSFISLPSLSRQLGSQNDIISMNTFRSQLLSSKDQKQPNSYILNTQRQLKSIMLTQISQNPQSNTKYRQNLSTSIDSQNNSIVKSLRQLRGQTSCSLPQLYKIKNRQLQKQEYILKKIIEQRQIQSYSQWFNRNSIAQRAKNHSKHRQIKQVIEKYLKNSQIMLKKKR